MHDQLEKSCATAQGEDVRMRRSEVPPRPAIGRPPFQRAGFESVQGLAHDIRGVVLGDVPPAHHVRVGRTHQQAGDLGPLPRQLPPGGRRSSGSGRPPWRPRRSWPPGRRATTAARARSDSHLLLRLCLQPGLPPRALAAARPVQGNRSYRRKPDLGRHRRRPCLTTAPRHAPSPAAGHEASGARLDALHAPKCSGQGQISSPSCANHPDVRTVVGGASTARCPAEAIGEIAARVNRPSARPLRAQAEHIEVPARE